MATESVVPDQSTDEQTEKKVSEEIKVVKEEGVSPSKEDGETDEQKLKSRELASPEAPVAESEGKTDDKQIDPSAIVEVEKTEQVDDAHGLDVPTKDAPKATEELDPKVDVSSVLEPAVEVVEKEPEEQPKISDAPESTVEEPLEQFEVPPTPEPASEVGSKPEEASEAESKIVDKPESAVEEPEVGKESKGSESEPKIVEKPESVVEEPEVGKEPEVLESEPKLVEKSESAVEESEVGKESAKISAVEEAEVAKESEEVSKSIEKPESAVEEPELGKESEVSEPRSAVEVEDKPQEQTEVVEEVEKKSEILEHKESEEDELAKEPEVGKESEEVSESLSKVLEIPESAVEVEEKPKEQSEVVEETETKSETLEPKESEDGELVKDEVVVVDKVEEVTVSLKEEQIGKDQEPVASESSDTVVSTNHEAPSDPKDGASVLPDLEKAGVEDTKKEEYGVDVVEVLSKEAALEVEKVEEKNAEVEESTQPETTKTEDASDCITATEVTEKTFEGEKASREVEVVADEKKEEIVKDNIATSAETTKDRDVDVVDVVDTAGAIKEPFEEPRDLELEVEAKDMVEAVDVLDKPAEVVEETAKSDAPNPECPKDVHDSKTDTDPPKEVPTKSHHKQSNNIISKVKQSFVKVKKAIIGKSPSSKTISSDVKGDINVK